MPLETVAETVEAGTVIAETTVVPALYPGMQTGNDSET